MKVVPLSDLHGYLPKPEQVPECDVVTISGDFVPLEYQNDDCKSIAWFCLEFVPWTDKLPCKKVVLVAGNHDFFMEHIMLGPVREDGSRKCRSASEVLSKLLPDHHKGQHKIVYLRDNSWEFEGKRFYGTPWTTGLPGWAFACTEEEFAEHLKQMPKKLDVLLTHAPASMYEMGTVHQHGAYNNGANHGSEALDRILGEREIGHTFCGHVHTGMHKPFQYKTNCWIANVSVKDEDYKVQTYYFPTYEI
jgi:hypothetical protein